MEASTHDPYGNKFRRVLMTDDVIMEASTYNLNLRQMGPILVSHFKIGTKVNLRVYRSTCILRELYYEEALAFNVSLGTLHGVSWLRCDDERLY